MARYLFNPTYNHEVDPVLSYAALPTVEQQGRYLFKSTYNYEIDPGLSCAAPPISTRYLFNPTYNHEVDPDLGRAEAVDPLAEVDPSIFCLHRADLQHLVVCPEPEHFAP
jgi:hypothetical protein